MKRSISVFMFIVMALISACNVREPGIDNGDVTSKQVDLKINVPGIELKTRAIGLDQENEIESIYLLAFKIDGETETFDYAAIGTKTGSENNGASQTFSVKVQIKEYPQRFVVITNANTEVAAIVDAANVGDDKATMLAALKFSLEIDRWEVISPDDYTAFPMWGESGEESITSSSTSLSSSIQMLRMVAKINVQLDTENNNTSVTDVFKLKTVYLYNTNDMGHIVPSSGTVSNGVVTAPTVPSKADLIQGPIEYSDFSSSGLEDVAMNGAIYLFETEAATDRADATCIVIGGHYGTETEESYYRVDFTENDGSFSHILRNHQYVVNITRVSGRGYDSPAEAFNAKAVNIEADVIYWNQNGMVNVATDGQYVLSVSEDEFIFEESAVTAGTGGNILNVLTNYETTASGARSGWYVEKIVDAEDITTEVTWLTLTPSSGNANVKTTVTLTAPENNTGADRSAIVWIAAGRLRVAVNVTQEVYTIAKRFARSNIVWTGTKLTFAVTREDNATIPANSQGVFFKWGSLVAIAPSDLSSEVQETTKNYVPELYPNGHILFSPIALTDYEWLTIPYTDETAAPFDNNVTTEDDFAGYGPDGFGFDTTGDDTKGTGDICRYISKQGWVSGNWRLPTNDEYNQLRIEQVSISNNGPFTVISVTPDGEVNTSGKGLNAYGFYQYPSGRWLGKWASASSGELSPSSGVYFPASGGRNISGVANAAGGTGFCWLGSSHDLTYAYGLLMSSDDMSMYGAPRYTAFPVRCIRE